MLETVPDHLVPAPTPQPVAEPSHPRYAFGDILGRGATARVLAARDRTFGREVAVKVLSSLGGGAAARFLREARITALLDHPNIVTVHDLEFTQQGSAYLVMRRIAGTSLGDLIRRSLAAAGGGAGGGGEGGEIEAVRDPAIATPNAVVTILLKVCDALERAHEAGVIHRDVKPDNILVGGHGEVVLADWGEALLKGEESETRLAVGTPAYMAPEQARGLQADTRSDIYACGATLFHALALRPPTDAGDAAGAVAARARGQWTEPTARERRRIPAGLLAVIRQAMAADPAARYPTIAALRRDLMRFQEGLSVAALHEPWPVRVVRSGWRHRRGVAAAVVLAAVIGALVGALAWDRARGIARWGDPIAVESFSDDLWRQRWAEYEPGTWQRDGQRLVTCGPGPAVLIWPHRLQAPFAIEYDGEITAGSAPCDLSCIWWEGDDLRNHRSHFLDHDQAGYWVQLGANDNTFSAIHRHPGNQRVAFSPRRLTPGVVHHLRLEFERDAVRAYVDGELWLEHRDLFPVRNGYFGLYGYYPGKAFTNVKVWSKGVPELVPVLGIGDAAYLRGEYAVAANEWRRVADSHIGTDLAADAMLRTGLAEWQAGDRPAALTAWQGLTGERGDLAAVMRLQAVFDNGDLEGFARVFTVLWGGGGEQRVRLADLWSSCMAERKVRLHMQLDAQSLALVRLRDQVFPDDPATAIDAAEVMIHDGRAAEVLTRMPDQPRAVGDALLALGRNRELLTRHRPAPFDIYNANLAIGDIDAAVSGPLRLPPLVCFALAKAGRVEDARAAGDPATFGVLCGDPADGLGASGWRGEVADAARLELGRLDEVAAAPVSHWGSFQAQGLLRMEDRPDAVLDGEHAWVQQSRWLRAYEDGGTPAPALAREVAAAPFDQRAWDGWFVPWFAQPMVEGRFAGAEGQRVLADLAASRVDMLGQRPHFLALAIAGGIGRDEFLKQPIRAEAGAWWLVAQGMRAEIAGDSVGALSAYHGFQALPMQQRLLGGLTVDAHVERFVGWRVRVLGDGGGSATAPGTAP